jgi:hypothetical protein
MQPPFKLDDNGVSHLAKGTLCRLKVAATADCLARDPNLCDLYVLLRNSALFALIFGLLHTLSLGHLKLLRLIFFISTLCRQLVYLNSVS